VSCSAKGTGNTFQTKTNYTKGAGLNSLSASDLNGDGVLDLITANDSSNNSSVLLGNGDSTFLAKTD